MEAATGAGAMGEGIGFWLSNVARSLRSGTRSAVDDGLALGITVTVNGASSPRNSNRYWSAASTRCGSSLKRPSPVLQSRHSSRRILRVRWQWSTAGVSVNSHLQMAHLPSCRASIAW